MGSIWYRQVTRHLIKKSTQAVSSSVPWLYCLKIVRVSTMGTCWRRIWRRVSYASKSTWSSTQNRSVISNGGSSSFLQSIRSSLRKRNKPQTMKNLKLQHPVQLLSKRQTLQASNQINFRLPGATKTCLKRKCLVWHLPAKRWNSRCET